MENQRLETAIAAHRSGDLQTAERLYRAILAASPDHSDANHNLGVLMVSTRGPEFALPFLRAAIAVNVSVPQYWESYLKALHQLNRIGEITEAVSAAESQGICQQTLASWQRRYIDGEDAQHKKSALAASGAPKGLSDSTTMAQEPSSAEISNLHELLQSSHLGAAEQAAYIFSEKYPSHPLGWNVLSSVFTKQGRIEESLWANRKLSATLSKDARGLCELGIRLRETGQLSEARKVFEQAVKIKPRLASAHRHLGMCLASLGQFQEAEGAYKAALEIDPALHAAHLDLGVALQRQGRLEDAKARFESAIKLNPDDPASRANLGVNYRLSGNLGDALSSLEKAYRGAPTSPEICAQLGFTLQALNRGHEAISFLRKAVQLRPEYAEAFAVLGNLYCDSGQTEAAKECYDSALRLHPDYAEVHCNLGILYKNQNKLGEARKHYQRAIHIDPDFVEAHSNLGVLLGELENFEGAMAEFEKAVSLNPRYLSAWTNGADTLENWNKLPELEDWLAKAMTNFADPPGDLKFFKAQLLWRKKLVTDSSAILSEIATGDLPEHLRAGFFNLRAKCFDSLGDYISAYRCFDEMNVTIQQSPSYLRADPDGYLTAIQRQLTQLRITLPNKTKRKKIGSANGPNFLVGFPRSGTTLLDTILRSHSQIKVIEEKPIVNLVRSFIERNGVDDSVGTTMAAETKQAAREIYWTELQKFFSGDNSESIVIDKLPLNIIHTPLIHRLFPDAKFILALRHPLDTVLSCWMQNFAVNDAMANFVDLDRTVETYCAAMETFKICREAYDLAVHEITYEGLISNIEAEIDSLLKFLGTGWESQMSNYQKTALERGKINTPSYSQVVRPIYYDAKFRWLNYQDQLSRYRARLRPWIEEFGYQAVTPKHWIM